MRWATRLALILVVKALGSVSPAQTEMREVKLEWAQIEHAAKYDVEVLSSKDQSSALQMESLVGLETTVKLRPGQYLIRVRSRDERGLPGPWGQPQLVDVPDFQVIISQPREGSIIEALDHIGLVEIKLQSVEGRQGQKNRLVVVPIDKPDQKPVADLLTSLSQLEIQVPIGSMYELRVFSSDSLAETPLARSRFSVVGRRLPPPTVQQIGATGEEVVLIARPDEASRLVIEIQGTNPTDQRWETLKKIERDSNVSIPLKSLPETRPLVISAQATAELRAPSAVQSFLVRGSNETESAIRTTEDLLFRRSPGSSLYARYNLAYGNYQSMSFENASSSRSSGVTGALSAGGNWFTKTGGHGFNGQIDFGGLTIEGSNFTFLRGQTSYLFRYVYSPRIETRLGAGLRYATLPEIGRSADESLYSGTAWSMGPLGSGEFWLQTTTSSAIQAQVEFATGLFGQSASRVSLSQSQSLRVSMGLAYRWSPSLIANLSWMSLSETLTYPGRNLVGNLSGTNEIKLQSQSVLIGFEWGLP